MHYSIIKGTHKCSSKYILQTNLMDGSVASEGIPIAKMVVTTTRRNIFRLAMGVESVQDSAKLPMQS